MKYPLGTLLCRIGGVVCALLISVSIFAAEPLHTLIGDKVEFVRGKAMSLKKITITVRNTSSGPIQTVIEPGTVFLTTDYYSNFQPLIAVAPVEVTIGAEKERTVSIQTACADNNRALPSGFGAFYGSVRFEDNPDFARVRDSLYKYSHEIQQAIVWLTLQDIGTAGFRRYFQRDPRTGETNSVVSYRHIGQAMEILHDAVVDVGELRIWKEHGWLIARDFDPQVRAKIEAAYKRD